MLTRRRSRDRFARFARFARALTCTRLGRVGCVAMFVSRGFDFGSQMRERLGESGRKGWREDEVSLED